MKFTILFKKNINMLKIILGIIGIPVLFYICIKLADKDEE